MALIPGDKISCQLIPSMQHYEATVHSITPNSIILELLENPPITVSHGQYIKIEDAADDVDYYNEAIGQEGNILRLQRMWTGKRDYFRVDDVFPVVYKKIAPNSAVPEARIYPGYSDDALDLEAANKTVNPLLWKLLVDINTKLGLLLDRINIGNEDLARAERIDVNISASGMRFAIDQDCEIGDLIEVKMLLPTNPNICVIVAGKVMRIEKSESIPVISILFINLTEDIQNTIIQYTLKRQRNIIQRCRKQD